MLAIIYLFRLFKDVEYTYDLTMIMMGQAGFMSLSLYKSDRNKKMNLIFTIISLLLFLVETYLTVVSYELI